MINTRRGYLCEAFDETSCPGILCDAVEHQWALVGIIAVTAFVLEFVGLHNETDGEGWSWPAAIYFSLSLFGFNYDVSGDGANP